MFAARQEVRFDFFKKMFQAHNQPSFSMVSSTLRNSGPYSYLPADEAAQSEVFFVQFQATQCLSAVGIADD